MEIMDHLRKEHIFLYIPNHVTVSWGPGPPNSANGICLRTFAFKGQWEAVLLFISLSVLLLSELYSLHFLLLESQLIK